MKCNFLIACLLAAFFVTHCSSVQVRQPSATKSPTLISIDSKAFEVIRPKDLGANYKKLLAVSDIHGSLDKITTLLKNAGVIKNDTFEWNSSLKKTVLVIIGDSIDKGDQSIQTLLSLQALQDSASKASSKVVWLLGNHEAAFLADYNNDCSKELLASAEGISGIQRGKKLSCKDIYKGPPGDIMRSMKVGAVIGDWFFVHSGYLATKKMSGDPRDHAQQWFNTWADQYAQGDYYNLNAPKNSPLSAHDWYKKESDATKEVLEAAGFTGMVVGHEPSALGIVGNLGINQDGWLIKIDGGMNPDAGDSDGFLLSCEVPSDGHIPMMVSDGKPWCDEIDSLGNSKKIKVQK